MYEYVITFLFLYFVLKSLIKTYLLKSPQIELRNKTVLITGASSGIGKALAFHLTDTNYSVRLILGSRNIKQLESIKNEIAEILRKNESEIKVFKLDLEDNESIINFVDQVEELKWNIDYFINSAGQSSRGTCIASGMDVYRKIMETNFFGPVLLTQKLLQKNLINKIDGHIISIGSVQALVAIAERSAYSASKHANIAYFDSLRSEMKKTYGNVRVLTVHPSYIKTNLSLNALNYDGNLYSIMDKNTMEGMDADLFVEDLMQYIIKNPNATELIVSDKITIKLAVYLRRLLPSIVFSKVEKKYLEQH